MDYNLASTSGSSNLMDSKLSEQNSQQEYGELVSINEMQATEDDSNPDKMFTVHPLPFVLTPHNHITSLAGYDTTALIGTAMGHLLMYGVKENSKQRTFELLKCDQNFSSEPIVKLDVVSYLDERLLISLSNEIRMHKIGYRCFDYVHSDIKTKGATLFAINKYNRPDNSEVQICVLVKRQLQFWHWKNDKLLKYRRDIDIRNTFVGDPKHIHWNKSTVCVGYIPGYVVYDLSNKRGKIEILNSVISEPCISIINGLLSIVKDDKLVAVDRKSGEIISQNASLQSEALKPFKPHNLSRLIRQLVWDRPFAFAVLPNGIEVLRLDSGSFTCSETLTEVHEATHLVRSKNGILFAASASELFCILKSSEQFSCYNCGQKNDHFSKNCPNLDQQWTRCPKCKNVAKTKAAHKITCKDTTGFISKRIGCYELPLMDFHIIRFVFKNIDQIFCAESTSEGAQNFLITKFFSVGTNIQMQRTYGPSNEFILDLKFKPAISMSFGRLNSSSYLASIMLCEDQLRINHYHHIDQHGNVSYSLKTWPRKDSSHDIDLKLTGKAKIVLFSMMWNDIEANIAMDETAFTIHGSPLSNVNKEMK